MHLGKASGKKRCLFAFFFVAAVLCFGAEPSIRFTNPFSWRSGAIDERKYKMGDFIILSVSESVNKKSAFIVWLYFDLLHSKGLHMLLDYEYLRS